MLPPQLPALLQGCGDFGPLMGLFFLLLSLTAMFAVPVSMNVYWLIGGVAASVMNKAIKTHEKAPQIIQPEIVAQPGSESAPTEG